MELAPSGQPTEKKETALRKKVVNACATKLSEIWSKAFTAKHVVPRKTITNRIRRLMHTYYNEVVKAKHVGLRQAQQEWKKKALVLFDLKCSESDPELFEDAEKCFYYDQKHNRKFVLDKKIDWAFENNDQEFCVKQAEEEKLCEEELSFIMDDEKESESNTGNNSLNKDVSLNRSGFAWITSGYRHGKSNRTILRTSNYTQHTEVHR